MMAREGDCVLRPATPIASLRHFGQQRRRAQRDSRRYLGKRLPQEAEPTLPGDPRSTNAHPAISCTDYQLPVTAESFLPASAPPPPA